MDFQNREKMKQEEFHKFSKGFNIDDLYEKKINSMQIERFYNNEDKLNEGRKYLYEVKIEYLLKVFVNNHIFF